MFLAFAEGGIQLIPDGTLFVHIAIILVMIYVLNRTLFKPINAVLDRREANQGGRSSEAQGILKRVDERMTGYEQSLRAARAESYSMLESERGAAVRDRQEKLNAVRDDVKARVEAEKRSIETETETARVSLESDARRLANEIGSRVLDRQITESI
ncbi:MAG: hypothetical protein MSG64_09395 [Pyrinomonadaceae bacterium MAG19_C2-C3]|nr:hypothetical protein [Pyrinomonadaceae bacterium MAG19_C2-C3]